MSAAAAVSLCLLTLPLTFHSSSPADDKDLGELRALLAGMEADGEIVQQPGQVYAPA